MVKTTPDLDANSGECAMNDPSPMVKLASLVPIANPSLGRAR